MATLHANELVVSKIRSGTDSERDAERISDLLDALKRQDSRLQEMLDHTYARSDLRDRDRKVMPVFRNMVKATQALKKYLEDKDEGELKKYFLHRDEFLNSIIRLKDSFDTEASE
ncbi:MAG: hypothetical protein JW818_12700 [Pirellulales bacterium]|nr:hypothetical protein [Pirellulales bacterium]